MSQARVPSSWFGLWSPTEAETALALGVPLEPDDWVLARLAAHAETTPALCARLIAAGAALEATYPLIEWSALAEALFRANVPLATFFLEQGARFDRVVKVNPHTGDTVGATCWELAARDERLGGVHSLMRAQATAGVTALPDGGALVYGWRLEGALARLDALLAALLDGGAAQALRLVRHGETTTLVVGAVAATAPPDAQTGGAGLSVEELALLPGEPIDAASLRAAKKRFAQHQPTLATALGGLGLEVTAPSLWLVTVGPCECLLRSKGQRKPPLARSDDAPVRLSAAPSAARLVVWS